VTQYQKGKTSLDFTEARDSEWQWHKLGHVQACTSLQTDNHASMPPLSFLQAGCSAYIIYYYIICAYIINLVIIVAQRMLWIVVDGGS